MPKAGNKMSSSNMTFNSAGIMDYYNGWRKSLTKDEKDALYAYVQDNYMELNDGLRYGFPDRPIFERIAAMVPFMDSAIQKGGLPKNLTLYRGTDEYSLNLMGTLKKGSVLKDLGYSSTSTQKSVASGFGNKILRISAKRGTHAAFIRQGNEIILERNAKLRVKKINGNIIDVTIVE